MLTTNNFVSCVMLLSFSTGAFNLVKDLVKFFDLPINCGKVRYSTTTCGHQCCITHSLEHQGETTTCRSCPTRSYNYVLTERKGHHPGFQFTEWAKPFTDARMHGSHGEDLPLSEYLRKALYEGSPHMSADCRAEMEKNLLELD